MAASLLLLLILLPLATPVSAIAVPRPKPNSRPSPTYSGHPPNYSPNHYLPFFYPPNHNNPSNPFVPMSPRTNTGPPFPPSNNVPSRPSTAPIRPNSNSPPNHDIPPNPVATPPNRQNSNSPPKRPDHDSAPNPKAPPSNSNSPPKSPDHDSPPNLEAPPPNQPNSYSPPKSPANDIPPNPDVPPSNPVNPPPNSYPPPPDVPPQNPNNPPPNTYPPPNPDVPPPSLDNTPPNSYPPPYPDVPPSNPGNPTPNTYPPPYMPPNRFAPPSPYVCMNPIVRAAHTIIRKSATHYLEGRADQGALVLDISIGSGVSQRILRGVLDITSELIWVQCGHCRMCPRLTPRGTRTFLPDASPSFSRVGCGTQLCERVSVDACDAKGESPCKYVELLYGNTQYTSGFLGIETFTFGGTTAPSIVFGCSDNITVLGLARGASGFLGFSRGPLSLVSQLNMSGFSYFISHKDSSKSFFGFWADPACAVPVHQQSSKHSRYTPLLRATANQNPYLYYVNLTGVKVDGQLLTDVPAGTFDVRADGSGGVYLSTTLPVTYLEEAAYNVLRQQLETRIESQGVAPVSVGHDLPLCYMTRSYKSIQVPRLALVFDGADASMDLYPKNYFLPVDGGQTCLAILPSTGGSVLGSLLQVGRTITYNDVQGGGGWLSFD